MSRNIHKSNLLKLSKEKPFKKDIPFFDTRKTNSAGFTIIELITVVFIIGVLATIAFFSYGEMVKKAKKVSAISDIKNIVKDIRIEMLDNATIPSQNPPDNLDIGNAFPHLAGYVDPWGNPYQYASPPVRTKPGSPLPNNWINREFDVYSLGEDGTSDVNITVLVSLDDIICAEDGDYVGIASRY